jgi:bifunctional UDP-N-acetylglucosamine pyrophosphorylase/glucosamine-1-phosphate N-acetyltransferase
MGAEVPKVLLPVAGRPLLSHVIAAARAAGIHRLLVIVGKGREQVQAAMAAEQVEFVVQPEQRGTADAVLACAPLLSDADECVVLCGDAPLVRPSTIRRLTELRRAAGADVAVFTAVLERPGAYGRIVRSQGDFIEAIVEQKDANDEVRRIREVNSGAYSFCWGAVKDALARVRPSPVSGEYYLTDIVAEVRARGGTAIAVKADDPTEMLGANTPAELAELERQLAARQGDPGA